MENPTIELPIKERKARNPASTTCPKCDADDTRSFEMVHSEGTSSGTFSAGSYTLGVGPTLTKGQTSSQSVLASKTQPPEKPAIKFGAILVTFFGSFFLMWILVSVISPFTGWLNFILVIGITGLLTFGAYMFETKRVKPLEAEYQKNLATWKRNWICLRCENAWRRVAVG